MPGSGTPFKPRYRAAASRTPVATACGSRSWPGATKPRRQSSVAAAVVISNWIATASTKAFSVLRRRRRSSRCLREEPARLPDWPIRSLLHQPQGHGFIRSLPASLVNPGGCIRVRFQHVARRQAFGLAGRKSRSVEARSRSPAVCPSAGQGGSGASNQDAAALGGVG